MKTLHLYRVALVLLTAALVAVSVAYVREHQRLIVSKKLQKTHESKWQNKYLMNNQQRVELLQWRETANELETSAALDADFLRDREGSGPFLIYRNSTPSSLKKSYDKMRNVALKVHAKWGNSLMWEDIARVMSKEADRRHLDKGFPRVKD